MSVSKPPTSTKLNNTGRTYLTPQHRCASIRALKRRAHAEKTRALDGRLAGFTRTPPPQGIQNPPRGTAAPGANAQGDRRAKKSPGLGKVAPLAEAWQDLAPSIRARKHRRTISNAYAELAGSTPLHRLPDELAATLTARWRERLSPITFKFQVSAFRGFLSYLIKKGAPESIDTTPRKLSAPPRTTIATQEEITKLYAIATPAMRCMLTITAGHGLRIAEAAQLSPAQLDREHLTITYPTKGNAHNTLPVTPELLSFFDTAPATDDPETPLISLWYGKRMSIHTIEKHWGRLKRKSGVNPKLNIHDLRRTLAVRVYDQTKDIRAVQQILGHKQLATTCRYLEHRDQGKLRGLLRELTVPGQRQLYPN